MASIEPRSARALPTRPPFLRNSSVSSAPYSFERFRRSVTLATIDSSESPSAARRAAVRQRLPRPIETMSESTTTTGQSAWTACAATCADCMVAESLDDRLMQMMPVAPSAIRRRNAASKAPADGADVSGSTSESARRRQNSSVLSSLRSTSSSLPKRMVSGTTSMPSRSIRSSGRSQALSVTTRTPMAPPGRSATLRPAA